MSDRDVIVTEERSSGAGALVAGIIAALAILLAIWYFGFRGDDADVNVDIVPETVVTETVAP